MRSTTMNLFAVHGRKFRKPTSVAATFVFAWLLGIAALPAWGQSGNVLTDIGYASLPGNRVQVKLTLSQPAPDPLSFTIDNPARIALDFQGVSSKLEKKSQNIGVGAAASVSAVEAKGRTRVVLNLVKLVPYQTRVEGNNVFITLESPTVAMADAPAVTAAEHAVTNVDFRRGKKGEGRVIVTLSDSSGLVDVAQEGSKLIVSFVDTKLPEAFMQRLDVVDFATPVNSIDTTAKGNTVRMEVSTNGAMEHLAFQSENVFTLEVQPITKEEQKKAEKAKFGYTGEKLSLNFQNIEVRAVLQLIADFTGLNLVASDTVAGNVTLRLKNVPWDQALDIVLKTKGLDMRQLGNVILVAPAEEIAAREKQELEAAKQILDLEPVRTELIQINYAKASEIATLLKAQEASLLTERGSVSIDERTNTLLVLETDRKLSEIRSLVTTLDIPIKQVLIESRIVIANSGFSKDLGVRVGASRWQTRSDGGVSMITGSLNDFVNQANGDTRPIDDTLNVNLPPSGTAGQIAVGILGSDFLVALELAAMQTEGNGEVISNPRVITANQREATIEQGVEVPYTQASSSGATTVSFKKAVLSLKVKPQITPDDRVIMDLIINKDSVGEYVPSGTGGTIPSINTRQISTQVLVDNGETVVLGGIFEQVRNHNQTKVPFLGDLPVLGRLFRSDINTDDREELLIFITPKIMKEALTAQ